MVGHLVKISVVAALVLLAGVMEPDAGAAPSVPLDGGLIKVRSAYPVDETVVRLRSAIEAKGIMVFAQVEQSRLAAERDIALRPSVLLIFGNAAIGARFIAANPLAGLDWPVRLLVAEDQAGQVWAVYEDFAQMARRYGIAVESSAVATAARVIASITADVAAR